jgi:hypothetical protein
VNGIERDLGGQAKVVRIELLSASGRELARRFDVRIDLLSASGRELARRFDVRAIPTLLVFDGEKNLVHRYEGVPNRKEVVAQVKALR